MTDEVIRGAIDVVIPMRNGAATVLGTLASVSRQTHAPRQVIVVDDGSDDDGAARIEALGDPRITIIRTAAVGVSHARNTGVRHARAEYIAFLDCDDLWAGDKLRRQLHAISQAPEVDVVVCATAAIARDGTCRPLCPVFEPLEGAAILDVANKVSCAGWASAALVRRSAVVSQGGFDESLSHSEDFDLWSRLARTSNFACVPETLSFSVARADSVTRRRYKISEQTEILLQNLRPRNALMAYADPSGMVATQCLELLCGFCVRHPLTFARKRLWSRLKRDLPALKSAIAPDVTTFAAALISYAAARVARRLMRAVRATTAGLTLDAWNGIRKQPAAASETA
jgi:glycosyltransferase involved in cell wall biosynthesis